MSTVTENPTKTAMAVVKDRRAPENSRIAALGDVLRAEQGRILSALPKILSPDRLISVVMNSVRKNPKLLNCTPQSLFGAIAEAGQYGWTPDGVMGHCYLVPFGDEVVLIPGYKGLKSLAQRRGCAVWESTVHDGDEFDVDAFMDGDRGYHIRLKGADGMPAGKDGRRVLLAYAVATLPSGLQARKYMVHADIINHRNQYSQGWKTAVQYKRENESPWYEDNEHEFRCMCCKTVLLEMIHRGDLPLSIDEIEVAGRDPDSSFTAVALSNPTNMTDLIGLDPPTDRTDDEPPDQPEAKAEPAASGGPDEAEQFLISLQEQLSQIDMKLEATALLKEHEAEIKRLGLDPEAKSLLEATHKRIGETRGK